MNVGHMVCLGLGGFLGEGCFGYVGDVFPSCAADGEGVFDGDG